MEEAELAKVRICYGRESKSRGNTYTMVFGNRDAAPGEAFVVPAQQNIADAKQLMTEAAALWQAESFTNDPNAIGNGSWGCVGACFNPVLGSIEWKTEWSQEFGKKQGINYLPVTKEGILNISWPKDVHEEVPADFDILLATATQRAPSYPPASDEVACRWVNADCGYEEYFFNNVYYGLRTPDDMKVWAAMKAREPHWKNRWSKYMEAIKILEGS